MADPRYVRAFPGGVGSYKCGSNYGPTLYVQNEAAKKGCQQVLWLYDKEEYLTEAGTMNIFLVIKNDKGGRFQLNLNPLNPQTHCLYIKQSLNWSRRLWMEQFSKVLPASP